MKRFIVFAFLGLAVLAVALWLTDYTARGRAIADADRTLAARARMIADTIDRTLQWRMTEAFTFAALPSLRGFAASDETERPARTVVALVELKAMVAADSSIRVASIVDPLGEVVLTTDSSMRADWGNRVFVREALAGHLYASAPSRDFGEVSQFYSAPIIDNAGNVAGALVVRVAVQELWGALSAPPEVMLVDENGVRIVDRSVAPQTFTALVPLASAVYARVLLEKRYGVEVTQISATHLDALADAIGQDKTATLTYRDANGRAVRAATQRIATYPWTVIVFQDEDTVLVPSRDAVVEAIGLGAVALIAGAILGMAFRGQGQGK